MATTKSKLSVLAGSLVLGLGLSSMAQASQVLDFKLDLAEDGETYQLWMRPDVSPTLSSEDADSAADMSLSGQVTFKVPHEQHLNILGGVQNAIEKVEWFEASRVNAPVEDAASDYISISFVGTNDTSGYNWEGGKETLVFAFKLTQDGQSAKCVENVALMGLDDPFNVRGNSANTNPGNHFTNLGWGSVSENNYRDNYGEPISCAK